MDIHISASSLKDFLQCKHRYHFRRTKGQDWPTTTALVKGSVVHEAIDLYERGELEQAEVEAWATQTFLQRLSNSNVEFTKWDDITKLIKSVIALVATYFKYKRGRLIESELPFRVPMFSTQGVEFKLVGKIDQIVELDEGICVVDLKTGREMPSEFEIVGDYQFTIYDFAYESLYGTPPAALYNFQLNHGQYVKYERTQKHIDELTIVLDDVVNCIHSIGDSWHNRHKFKGWHCNRCMYRYVCYGIDN
jgi:CRISPR/Cas system-associated exonuclease Cas4 (RecB family)